MRDLSILALALSGSLLASSCGEPASSTEAELGAASSANGVESSASSEATEEAREPLPVVKYNPKDFPFVTVIRDDGKGKAGGWQEANTTLSFTHWVIPHLPREWQCTFIIGMPLRAEREGNIPPSRAATLSVGVTEDVARAMDYTLPPGIFCGQFVSRVGLSFDARHPKLGARVHR